MALKPKQKTFVLEYLKDKNATQAAIRAGYSKHTAHAIGQENLRKPTIAKAVEEALAKQALRCEISADRTVKEIADIAFQKLSKQEMKKLSGNKLKALELLGKRFGIFVDVSKVQVDATIKTTERKEAKEAAKAFVDELESEC